MALVSAATTLVFIPPATAHDNLTHYSFSGSSCTAGVDPVTTVFYGFGDASRSSNHTQSHTAWTSTSGSTQRFRSHGVCSTMAWQRGKPCSISALGPICSRFHVRARQAVHALAATMIGGVSVSGTLTMATPHHEDLVWNCGHAVDKGGVGTGLLSGFDQGRRKLWMTLSGASSAHRPVAFEYWGNTRTFKQCDGDLAGSNGSVAWIPVPSAVH